jgi:hypothetical protein
MFSILTNALILPKQAAMIKHKKMINARAFVNDHNSFIFLLTPTIDFTSFYTFAL